MHTSSTLCMKKVTEEQKHNMILKYSKTKKLVPDAASLTAAGVLGITLMNLLCPAHSYKL